MKMQEKIGGVTLDYTYYKGKDIYSDGDIEEYLLDVCKNKREQEALNSSHSWPVLYHLSDIRGNIIDWIPMGTDSEVLEIGSGCGAITGTLAVKAKSVTCIDLSKRRTLINAYRNQQYHNIYAYVGNFSDIKIDQKFDYVTLIGVWEYASLYVESEKPFHLMLEMIKEYLKPGGKIIIAIENKTGLKYWNGAVEDHTNKLYSGLNDYIGEKSARTFSKHEIADILHEVGINKFQFFYPMPDYKLPDTIYSDGKLPKAGDIRTYRKNYNALRLYNFYEATAFDQVCNDLMFDYFANSYLIMTGVETQKIDFVKYSNLRKRQFRICTQIKSSGGKKVVEKRPLCDEAVWHVQSFKEKELIWKNVLPNLRYLEGTLEQNAYIVPFQEGINADAYLYPWRNNCEAFIQHTAELMHVYDTGQNLKQFRMTQEFKDIFGEPEVNPEQEVCLPVTNVDLIFENIIMHENRYYSFDYEWIFAFPIPLEYVKWRSLDQLYEKYRIYLRPDIGKAEFEIALGIKQENINIWKRMEKNFAEYVYGKQRQENYLQQFETPVISQEIRI
jgi:2-polyprenyl-3-methyl-5-hydroxy-6-metoxy-1,4-benzoquinol methylase